MAASARHIELRGPELGLLPHHAGNKPGLAPRRLDVFFQEAVRIFADIAGPRIGPGPALVVGGAGGLAGVVALARYSIRNCGSRRRTCRSRFPPRCCAARPRRRRARRTRSNYPACAPARCSSASTPRLRHVGRIVEAPGAAAAVALAVQRAIGRIAGGDRRALIIAAGPVEIGLRLRRTRAMRPPPRRRRHQTRPEQAACPHRDCFRLSLSRTAGASSRGDARTRHLIASTCTADERP